MEMKRMKKMGSVSLFQKYKELFTTYKKCLMIGCSLTFCQQFVGVNTILQYTPEMIYKSGIGIEGGYSSHEVAKIYFISFASINLIGSTIAVFIIDKLGRRFIILRTLPGLFFALMLAAYSMGLVHHSRIETKTKDG